jgi:hypothetical protein
MNCGYGVCIWRGKMRPASRVMWEIANAQDAPDDKDVLHACDTPLCVNPSHLYIGTPSENAKDMMLKERTPQAILKPRHVREIRAELKNYRRGMVKALGKKYGVKPGTIGKLRSGVTHKYVEEETADVSA